MTMDKSLRIRRGLLRSRSVLTRAERLDPVAGSGPLERRGQPPGAAQGPRLQADHEEEKEEEGRGRRRCRGSCCSGRRRQEAGSQEARRQEIALSIERSSVERPSTPVRHSTACRLGTAMAAHGAVGSIPEASGQERHAAAQRPGFCLCESRWNTGVRVCRSTCRTTGWFVIWPIKTLRRWPIRPACCKNCSSVPSARHRWPSWPGVERAPASSSATSRGRCPIG